MEDARGFCVRLFRRYNDEHRHSGIAYHTTADVHYGRAAPLATSVLRSWRRPSPPVIVHEVAREAERKGL